MVLDKYLMKGNLFSRVHWAISKKILCLTKPPRTLPETVSIKEIKIRLDDEVVGMQNAKREALKYVLMNGAEKKVKPICFVGPAQSGKSLLVKKLAEAQRVELGCVDSDRINLEEIEELQVYIYLNLAF